MKATLCLFSVVILAGMVRAQGYVTGNVDELRGRTRISVDTRGDSELRQKIVDRIRKELPQIAVVENFAEAEIMISFRGDTHEISGGYEVTKDSVEVSSGRGQVSVPGGSADAPRPTIIIDYKNTQESRFEKHPWKKFVSKFIEAYKKANGRG